MKNLTSIAMIMAELKSIKNLLTKQNEFLQNLGFEAAQEIAPTSEITYTEASLKPNKIENFDYKISAFLKELGIPAHFSGYSYLLEAIKLFYNNPSMKKITKEIYPEIAKMYNVSYGGVERSIRYAIDTSFDKNNHHPFYQFYDMRPTNLAFVADAVDMFKMEDEVKPETVGQILK